MKNSLKLLPLLLIAVLAITLTDCSKNSSGYSPEMQAKIDSMQTVLKQMADGNAALQKNLTTFDTLDFTVFTNQEWVRLHESHSKDIKVNWPDGHYTMGIDRHIADLKALFVYAPDTRIKQHPIRFGDSKGEWTAVTGIMEGTFTKPMPIGNGKFIPPTGKTFALPMCTIGHWKNGIMVEESLFWDNQTYMKQIGLAK
ncbi:MAG: ester cyclase [Ignavibacteriaceae bacterium]|nr:ester cyclase [Ignavibacteriaceae bacterium]